MRGGRGHEAGPEAGMFESVIRLQDEGGDPSA